MRMARVKKKWRTRDFDLAENTQCQSNDFLTNRVFFTSSTAAGGEVAANVVLDTRTLLIRADT